MTARMRRLQRAVAHVESHADRAWITRAIEHEQEREREDREFERWCDMRDEARPEARQ